LPSWVGAECDRGATVASVSVPAQSCVGEQLAQIAFQAFSEALRSLGAPATRVWAFLPSITAHDSHGLNRYMRMNIGRTQAYAAARWPLPFMPAGTCVGHAGDLLVVHALAVPGPVRSIENPRQRPAWQYSSKFGPSAPPFTRAVLSQHLLLASGTAAVVGEDVVHPHDVQAQWQETLSHFATLRSLAQARGQWRSVQIYVRDHCDLSTVARLAQQEFADGVERILHAPLCRQALLVEVEAVADV
jgi:chorismate lyase/3-hydroxybenzoate synthase